MCRLPVLCVKVGVVAREFFKLNQEITNVELEPEKIIALSKETFDEVCNLCTRRR